MPSTGPTQPTHSSRTRPAPKLVRRAPILAFLGGALIVGGLVDRAGAPRVSSAVTAEAIQPVPVAAPAGAYTSSWFCAGATDSGANYAAGHVSIANEGTAPVSATVRVVGSNATSSTRTVTVAPGTVSSVSETVPKKAPWTGAIVDADGGRVAVSQVVDGPLGRATSPCATSGSPHWYLPTGQTRINASDTILLLNPYPTDSIVDMSFATDQGVENPQEFQSIDVPADGLVAENLGDHLRRRQSIATTVSARTGDVVAWEAEIVSPPPANAPLVGTPAANSALADPALPYKGVSVTLGAPSTGSIWAFPDGLTGNGIDEQYVIYNPGPQTATVRLAVGLQEGTAEPFAITVGPYSESAVVSENEARIPGGVPHTASIVSTNGVGVVAARTVAAASAKVGDTVRSGIGTLMGERVTARRWLIPVTATYPSQVGQVVVSDPGARPVTVTVGDGSQTSRLAVPAGGRASLEVAEGPDVPLTVSGPLPVYVEYDLFGTGRTAGFSLSTAVPLR